jgi:hypothetical protein
MFSIPPFVMLIPYAAVLLGTVFFSIFNISNLIKYGARNWIGLSATFIYVCGMAFILFYTWQLLPDVEWRQPIQVLGAAPQSF